MRCSPLHFLAFAVSFASSPLLYSAPVIETGEINGAKFTLARPARWNHRVLLHAHGLRAEDRPLVADLFPDQFATRTLLDEGWLIATTSFRRNGLIVADAIADLDALRAHIVATHGEPQRVLLEGESMGGLIVTLMAERDPASPRHYHGAIAIGAALDLREPNSPLGLSLRPHIPLLFLTNQSELTGPKNYVTQEVTNLTAVRAQLFRLARDGHVNVNQRERLVAIRAVNDWLDRGPNALPQPAPDAPFFDATIAPTSQPSQVAAHSDGRGFDARVVEVSAIYGIFAQTGARDNLPAHLFYRESAMFVAFLARRDDAAFKRLLLDLQDRRAFADAVAQAYGRNLPALWREFSSAIKTAAR